MGGGRGSGANGRELFFHANATLDVLLTLMTSDLYRFENKLYVKLAIAKSVTIKLSLLNLPQLF